MDVNLIERLNALKLHQAQVIPTAATYELNRGNQLEGLNDNTFAEALLRMQSEYERKLKEHDQMMRHMHHDLQQMQRRSEFLEQENHVLRQAMSARENYEAQIAEQKTQLHGLQDQVKQLRLNNYRLQLMVQQNERSSGHNSFMPPSPPDIF